MEKLNKLLLFELHKNLNAKFFEFAGWKMPSQYYKPSQEHLAVRKSVGIFDVSHMGRFRFKGGKVKEFIQYLTTNDARLLEERAMYTLICRENGGIIDDAIFFKDSKGFGVVVNASNREKDYNWFLKNAKDFSVEVKDLTFDSVMLAVQGPKAEATLQKLTDFELVKMKRFGQAEIKLVNLPVNITRTGYTGEDGFEIIFWKASKNINQAFNLFEEILNAGKEYEIKPCGLIARDTLRLEAGMVLYDHDINESITPLEANLGFVVKFNFGSFIGKEKLMEQSKKGVEKIRVGFEMIERGFPRPGDKIYSKERVEIGAVTSSGKPPTCKNPIGMGYVKLRYSEPGEKIFIETKTGVKKAKITKLPFCALKRI